MKVDFTKPIKSLFGEPMQTSETDSSPYTLAKASAQLLVAYSAPGLTPVQIVGRLDLARKLIAAKGPIEITLEDLVTIKDLATLNYVPLIAGQIHEMIEKATKK